MNGPAVEMDIGIDAPSDGIPPAAEPRRIFAAYLADLNDIRASGAGVPETSYYPALAALFNSVGKQLKPRVRCIIHTKNQGSGIPDGGLFTPDQFQRGADGQPTPGQLPARGVIEAKGSKADVAAVGESEQVRSYLARYGIALVTNLRDFLILDRDAEGRTVARESFSLAKDEDAFWRLAAGHRAGIVESQAGQFVEFIKRACLHAAPLAKPKDVAWFLASYARDALARVEMHKSLPALQAVRASLEDALGMRFSGEKGEHFFRSTLVQTVFYGVFSAWVRWHKDNPRPNALFDWRTAEWTLHVPFIRALYEEVATPSRLGPLGLVEVLDWTAGVLNRVRRGDFFRQFQEEQAVQYFYEPFLEAYDPELRKALGVWYTPREIVQYQVARVDEVLRSEMGLPNGLADPNVIVLDPCCGTGAYLVEVLRKIAETLRENGGDALVASDLKTAAMTRVFGFEIMPAPFVIAHLQLGLLLQAQGAGLSHEKAERAGVYLTNALTGWQLKDQPPIPSLELEDERRGAGAVKRDAAILVVLGNPPYNAFAGISPAEEEGLVEPYKGAYEAPKPGRAGKASNGKTNTITRYRLNDPADMGGWGIKKFNLDDLYIRFFRLAERRIAEMSGRGVVSFISNASYLSDPSFVVMRQRFLAEFDKLWLDSMNGDSRETGKLTPDGKPDPSVFSTEYNREGIRVGTAVCVMVRKPNRRKNPTVRFRQFWGIDKRRELLATAKSRDTDAAYRSAKPSAANRLSFIPENVAAQYERWPKLTDLCAIAPFNGPIERRGNALIQMAANAGGFKTLQAYLDRGRTDAEIAAIEPRFMFSSGEFRATQTRAALAGKVAYDPARVVAYPFKPFDIRLAYLDAAIQPLFSRPGPHLLQQRFDGNAFFISRDTADKVPEGPPFYFSKSICDYDCISGHARHFPLLLKNGHRLPKETGESLFAAFREKADGDEAMANLSAPVRAYLTGLKIKNASEADLARLLWLHVLAVGYSPAYLVENGDGIRRDWPRVPLPADRKALRASAELGGQIADLLDTEAQVPGVTGGTIGPALRTIGKIAKTTGGAIDPAGKDLAMTAGWGHFGKDGVVMPGRGNAAPRPYTGEELAAIAGEAAARHMKTREATALLGETTFNIYLNNTAYWDNIPANVWECRIGGYQVIKKWLSYREQAILGRAISPQEVREVTGMARRIAAIILLRPRLDENYAKVKAASADL